VSGTVTPNFRLLKPPFDNLPWDQAVNGNMDIIDAALGQYLTITNFVGVWTNAHAYTPGQTTIDAQTSTFWQCLLAHTSSASPTTFAQDRAATAGRWAPTMPSGTNNAGSTNFGRNWFRNGMFNVQQRGPGPFTSVAAQPFKRLYTLDGWAMDTVNDVSTTRLIAGTDAQRAQIGDESASNTLQVTFAGTAAAGSFTGITQPIEHVAFLANKTITVSFWASAASALRLGVSFYQYFGTGGSPSPSVQGAVTIINLSTVMTRYSVTFNIPSIAGKVLGTTTHSATVIQFILTQGGVSTVGQQSGTVTFWGVQCEIGSAPTALAKTRPEDDLDRAQYFYQNSHITLTGFTDGVAGRICSVWRPHAAPMSNNPTVTLGTPTYNNMSNVRILGTPGPLGFQVIADCGNSAGTANVDVDYTVSTEI
jgi:hypothetical protein